MIRDVLKSEHSVLFNDLPLREVKVNENKMTITRSQFQLFFGDITYCLDVLDAHDETTSIDVTKEGIFFAGQYFDAIQQIGNLLADARKSIFIVDNYVNEDVLSLLSNKKLNVTVKILTKSVSSALEVAANAFNKQYGDLEIRYRHVFHDRFVIIDNKDFYHLGASIKDLGHRGFMFSKIEESFVIDALRNQIKVEWKKAQVAITL